MADDIYFDGDPETDSARRQLERLLKQDKPRRRWPWIAAGLAGAVAWYVWPRTSPPRPSETDAPSAAAKKPRGSS